jgi:acetolactate synthase I/II/III large subunit
MIVSDYVVQFCADKGVRDIFLISGGGIMYLLDSVGRNADLRYYCNYHEQACVAAAEAYARVRNGIGVCLVTTGPGAANAISALPAAWVDSVPVVVIAGQNKRELIADYDKLRQLGPQEANVVAMAQPITKYAKSIRDPESIRYEMELAFYKATSGRPGPVFLEIPVDVQGVDVDHHRLRGFMPAPEVLERNLEKQADELISEVRVAKRPILIAGNGIHRANAQSKLFRLLEALHIPVAVPLTAKDVLYEDHPMNIGVFGTAGQRRANFAVQSSDLLVAMGAGLNSQKVGFNPQGFAPKAKKIIVDIDRNQLEHQIIRADVSIEADASRLLDLLISSYEKEPYSAPAKWLGACSRWKERYPVLMDEYFHDKDHVNANVFHDRLSEQLSPDDIMVTGNALDTTSYFQSFRVKRGQRTFNSGWGAMGWCLPMAIGACIGSSRRRTICVTGDGSFQFNSQELLTISHYSLPIKIFIFNNNGYSNIRGTQEGFFNGRYVAVDPNSGVATPNFAKLAATYGLQYGYINNHCDLEAKIRCALRRTGPAIFEVNISTNQRISPKASAFRRPDGTFESRPLEDMSPFLPRDEIWENMHQFDDD